jgi:hypothetical protein
LLLCATIVQVAAFEGEIVAARVQHVIRAAQDPLEAPPPSPTAPPLVPLLLPAPHGDPQLCVSQSNTGFSHDAHVLDWHCCNCAPHMV